MFALVGFLTFVLGLSVTMHVVFAINGLYMMR